MTLQADTRFGAFYWPIQSFDFPLKTFYVQTLILILFVLSYWYVFRSIVEGNPLLGSYATHLLYLLLLPFVFRFSPGVHGVLIVFTFLLFFFWRRAKFAGISFTAFLKTTKSVYFLMVIFVLALLLRMILFGYLTSFKEGFLWVDSGENFLNNALIFMDGDFPESTQVTLPYSYLLFLILKLVGPEVNHSLFVQSLLCTLIPIFVFYIGRAIFDFRVGAVSAIGTAFSSHLIYYSLVVHKAGLAAFFLTLSILILVLIIQQMRLYLVLLFGFCFGWSMLLDGMLAPLFLLGLVPLLKSVKKIYWGKYIGILVLGLLIAEGSFNWIVYKNLGVVYPLGRPSGVLKGQGQWNHANHEEGKKLGAMGYEPFDAPIKSLKVLATHPIKTSGLLLRKAFKEFQSYFLDHESIFFEPVLLNRETYFASSVHFYYFPILLLGSLGMVFSKKIDWKYKLVLGIPILYTVLFFSFFWLGTNRYRVVSQPLLLILFAYGVIIVLDLFSVKKQSENEGLSNKNTVYGKDESPVFSGKVFLYRMVILAQIILLSGLGYGYIKTMGEQLAPFYYKDRIKPANYRHSPWMTEQRVADSRLGQQALITEVMLGETESYDLAIKLTSSFGPATKFLQKMYLFLNDKPLTSITVPKKPGWVVFKNIRIEKGLNVLKVEHAFVASNLLEMEILKAEFRDNQPRFFLNEFKDKSVLLIDFKMVKSD